MFAATQQQRPEEQQDQLKQNPPSQPPPTAEEEALKRNTDCVYFLASPLTCKKGSECEYRHSEYARMNPRDCYYWLNANCLNPKCGFRHPPLDGLLGTQVAAPTGASLHTAVPVAAHVPYSSVAPSNSSKSAAPCIFFQKGYCLKGDICAFLHGPVPTSNKAQQATAANPINGPASSKNVFGAPTQQQNIPPANLTKIVAAPHVPKMTPKVETFPPRNGVGAKRYDAGLNEGVPRYKTHNTPPAVNGSSMVHAYASDEQNYHPGKDTDEQLRESSPGFDVLVDDELGDAEYYHGENQYGGQEGRNGNEYDMGRSANYDAAGDVDREMFRDARGYDSYGKYDREQRRVSSERRGYSKAKSPDRIGESDLRYRLSKHRKGSGLRSVVSHDHPPENNLDERGYLSSSRRGSHQHESSLSSRLRGRIKLPGSDTDSRSERDMERGRGWGRLSPGRPQISHSERLRDRIQGRVEERPRDRIKGRVEERSRDRIMDDMRPNFAGPKGLAELKVVDNKEHHVLRKRKALEGNQQSEGDLSFDGPMPLSEILKRKRQAKTDAQENGLSSLNKQDKDQKITKESLIGSNSTRRVVSPASNDEIDRKEESVPVIAEIEGKNEESSQLPVVSDHEVEDGMIVEEGVEEEHEQLEGDEQGEEGEEYYYEQGDEGDYNYEDAENLGPEEDYLDDEDGDDFAKTIGVVSS